MNIFVDSSVAIAASLSATGASRYLFEMSARNDDWQLLVSPWVLREVRDNLRNKAEGAREWKSLLRHVGIERDELILEWPLVFDIAKDKPVLISALACADVLLTLDQRDFGQLIGKSVYGMRVRTPGGFLREEREAGRLNL